MPPDFTLTIKGCKPFRGTLQPAPDPEPSPQLDPSQLWGFLKHDFQLGDYWGADKAGKTRWAPRTHGDPETVKTWFKEDRVSLTPAWQDFHKLMFTLAAFGEAKMSLFPLVQAAFERTMGPTVVITNKVGFPEGYMPLCMGGNTVRLLNDKEYRPNEHFGRSYKIETLNGSKAPPDVEEVFWTKPWLWSKATVARYAFSSDNIQGLASPWHHVIPFPKMDTWNAHVPLLNISNVGWNYVQTARVAIWKHTVLPNPYNPPLVKVYD